MNMPNEVNDANGIIVKTKYIVSFINADGMETEAEITCNAQLVDCINLLDLVGISYVVYDVTSGYRRVIVNR